MIQTTKRKKKKVVGSLIGMEESYVTETEALDVISTLNNKIMKIMKSHVGLENAISASELFAKVFNKHPGEVDVYKRTYWWTVIKKMMRQMRSTNQLFVVVRTNKIFVLKTYEELDQVQKRYDLHIQAIKNLKHNADVWIREERWKQYLKDE